MTNVLETPLLSSEIHSFIYSLIHFYNVIRVTLSRHQFRNSNIGITIEENFCLPALIFWWGSKWNKWATPVVYWVDKMGKDKVKMVAIEGLSNKWTFQESLKLLRERNWGCLGSRRRAGAKALGQHAETVQGIAGSPEVLERNEGKLDEQERRQEVGKGRPYSAGLKAKASTSAF